MEINGAQMFVKALQEEHVDTLFAYPGGTAIDLFDALYDAEGIDMILPRHEQALVHAADGYARSTGKVGVCLVTSGPGATNLVTGIATANYDSVPLVCFTGQVPMNLIGNDAFQEVDIVGITRSICKYAVTVRKREDLARIIKNAFYIARTGKPGPVLVDIPKDIQLAMGSDEYPDEVNIRGYKPAEGVHSGQLKKALAELNRAKKPVFLIGGGVNIAHARKEMQELCELTGIPVVTTSWVREQFRRTILYMLVISECMEILHPIKQSWNVMSCSRSEPDSMIVSPVRSTHLQRMQRSYISISMQHQSPEISR